MSKSYKKEVYSEEIENKNFSKAVENLEKIYNKIILPVEKNYLFGAFHSPPLTKADIISKPSVLVLGQYSVGKTTFINYILGREFPGCHIGPEPTTDSFMAIMGDKRDRIIPGFAAVVSTDLPFTTLNKFGRAFLNKFKVSLVNSPISENITFIDTPGVLSGEKQSIGRSYNFPEVVKWFVERADLILLFFDVHKLDISDEFKSVINVLKGHEEKTRVVLNKADEINVQQLIRVQGSLMWSLGKVLNISEVIRVYICSLCDEELRYKECEKLLNSEEEHLLNDLRILPINAIDRKVNEMVKRAKLVKVHGLIISRLKEEMSYLKKGNCIISLFKNENNDYKQVQLIHNLPKIFEELQKKYGLAKNEFPDVKEYQEKLKNFKFDTFNKYNKKQFSEIDRILTSEDMKNIMDDFQQGISEDTEIQIKSKYIAKL
ncbi:P-loop containing nucleoside triphosphate hydrolase protein [Neocallimastix lanati (nom. inval.)]|jgi:GTPase Era involved in 16S rRNA processing|uniref:Dynamin-type G domain-containing protein n=1 Tax=Neocallimastix californiae TaxID=1754190 RepID=A0A1Y2DKN5_9FUNG|nr:P-loop containing nucleoside triphosphate hydrolase protein [Neocallimastix sp. JGI-2020a]ORY59840.1 hypothetical protein LY90DRAFT_454407 [Neocallimastix californiae]|eukprot:ORY59840.1 hypothetical protein LY90DRAFT_454407 [Neocallimastix californiae]